MFLLRDDDSWAFSAREIEIKPESFKLESCWFLEINSLLDRMSMIGVKSKIWSIDRR